ncbi:hypothetical protein AVEN_247698-1 [Araneus ventricosus]|uniref:Secreted protein n=1 Tax=Araneus ventricosus TaxID=182803 RepID=A0A4Y2GPN1_ARAVE|nr:hypothetical protein AVEN_247698-1 [Araneus ventricosus]
MTFRGLKWMWVLSLVAYLARLSAASLPRKLTCALIQLCCIDGFCRRACCVSWISRLELLKEEISLSADSLSLQIDVDILLKLAHFRASFIAEVSA